MRTFTLESGTGRKVVTIEVKGSRLRLTRTKSDGTSKRTEKELESEARARSEGEWAARELVSMGYVEQAAARPATAKSASRPKAGGLGDLNVNHLFDDAAGSAEAAEPVLPRLAPVAAAAGKGAAAAPEKKKKKAGGKKKKKKAGESGDALDKRVLAGVGAVAAILVAFVGYIAYDAFLKPASIVGTWSGSMLDFEIGRPIIHTQYQLVLDDKKNASMTLQEKFTSVGTYALKGNLLKLNLKEQKSEKELAAERADDGETPEEKADDGEKPDPAEAHEQEYKVSLGRSTLDLFDPRTGKKMVQLIRLSHDASAGQSAAPAAAAKGLVVGAIAPADKAQDDRLASVEYGPKDGAFKARHPKGWTPETGSRPDNTYSWVTFTDGTAKIQIYADIQGSLLAGSPNNGQQEEGSELAPVHNAHLLYKKTAAEEFSDYKESEPTLFKGAGLGEGRIAVFTASGGGLLGSKLRGYRVTLLTNDRRVSVLCSCPPADFAKYKPTFLAVCRSLTR